MRLGAKQELFSELEAKLILHAISIGFKVRGGDAFRDPRTNGEMGVKKGYGHKNSCHKLKLARDLNLMKNGRLVTSTAGHKELGEWWKKQHELCRWGGDFSKPDGNHYSLEHNGHR